MKSWRRPKCAAWKSGCASGAAAGPQNHGSRDPEGGSRARSGKKTGLAVALAASGRYPVKRVSQALGVARSNVLERRNDARPGRGPQGRPGDVELTAAIRRLADARPTYGYRRIAALLKRERRSTVWPRSRQAHLPADAQARSLAPTAHRATAAAR